MWDAESYELIAALYDIEDDRHVCGHPLSETTSWAADPDNKKDRSIFYEPQPPKRCAACSALELAQKERESKGGSLDRSQVWSVRRTELAAG